MCSCTVQFSRDVLHLFCANSVKSKGFVPKLVANKRHADGNTTKARCASVDLNLAAVFAS
jgi:hypothetical protein